MSVSAYNIIEIYEKNPHVKPCESVANGWHPVFTCGCGKKCHLINNGACCSCSDIRPENVKNSVFLRADNTVAQGSAWGYCPLCRDNGDSQESRPDSLIGTIEYMIRFNTVESTDAVLGHLDKESVEYISRNGYYVYIKNLFVFPGYTNRGHGKRLMMAMIEDLAKKEKEFGIDITHIYLENTTGRGRDSYYYQFGFRENPSDPSQNIVMIYGDNGSNHLDSDVEYPLTFGSVQKFAEYQWSLFLENPVKDSILIRVNNI